MVTVVVVVPCEGVLDESADADVARTGATAETALDVATDSGGQLGVPHARSVGQHPPPRLAGHD